MGQLNCCERRSDTNERKDKYTERYNEGVGKINHHEQYRVERTLRTTSSESGQQQENSIGTQSSLSGSVKVGQPRLNSFGAQSSSSGKVKPGQPRLNSFGAQSSSSGKVKLGQQQLNSIGAQSSSSGPLTAGKQGLYSIGVHSSSSDCVKVEKQRQGSIGAQSSLSGSVKLGHYQHVRIGTQMQARLPSSHGHSRRPSNKARRQITLYHYTTKRNAMNIKSEKFVRGSNPSTTPFQYRRYGDGVYFTSLPPEMPPDKLALNNFTNRGNQIYGTGLYKKIHYVVRINFDSHEVKKINVPQRDVYLYEGSIDLTQYEGRYKIYENQKCPTR